MKTSIFNSIQLLAIATVLFISQNAYAQLAFPGAEGFGVTDPDCSGKIGGTAYLDECGNCVGGDTGLEPCDDEPFNVILQVEDASLSASMEITQEHSGYRGDGFVNFPKDDGYVQFDNISVDEGGAFDLTLRYALGKPSRTGSLLINGQAQSITVASTGSWTSWSTKTVSANLQPGANTIRIESTGNDFGNLNEISVEIASSASF